ncbi:hypothetical protein [Wolbachia endosymbiont (group A) of Clivina fossor]|uniref:hypothetical protein n=1 Tax=Wolbachia endosymbiont (group A) of Clivina fossor TaxID=3066133 RepID=UPI0031332D1D
MRFGITRHFDGFMRKEGPFNLKIAEYLSNEDIKNLRKAAIQTMDEDDCKLGEPDKDGESPSDEDVAAQLLTGAKKDTLVTEVAGNEGLQEAVVGNQDLRTAVTNTLKDDGNFQAAVKGDPDKEARKSLEIDIICGVIAALVVGGGCFAAGVQLSVLAIVGIAVAAALAVGIVAGGITYAVLKPSNKLDEPDSNKVASVAHNAL